MKKLTLTIALILTACGVPQISNTSTTAVNQYPTMLPTPTLAVNTKTIGDEVKEEAFNFFYELKNHVALGDYEHFAEEIRYPITVKVDGQQKTLIYAAEFEANFEKIFSQDMIQTFISTDELELTFTSDGVRVADGILWYDLICMNPECTEADFLVTEINN